MIGKNRTQPILILLAWGFLASSAAAQAPQNPYLKETQPTRGLTPFSDQLSSPIDNIEPMTGKLNLSIPLTTLPPGRAGIGFELGLNYDSHLYDPQISMKEGAWNAPPQYLQEFHRLYYSYLTNSVVGGGWSYNVRNYGLYLEPERESLDPQDYDENDCLCSEYKMRAFRLRVGLPDGSQHVLYLQGFPVVDGFYGIRPDGTKVAMCQNNTWGFPAGTTDKLTYFTLDGSYLKVEVDLEDGVPWEQKQWRLYFPDGKRVVGRSINAQAIYDANGNMILINNVYAPSNPPDMFWLYTEIEDEIGGPARRITIQHSTDAYSQNGYWWRDTIHGKGLDAQQDLTWAVDWQLIAPTPRYYNACTDPILYQYNDRYQYSTFPDNIVLASFSQHVVRSIQTPPLTGEPPQKTLEQIATGVPPLQHRSYQFGYSASPGMGELNHIRTPTGSEYDYEYMFDVPTGGYRNDNSVPLEYLINNNGVASKTIHFHDGTSPQQLVWHYSYTIPPNGTGETTVTAPDDGLTKYYYTSWNLFTPEDNQPTWGESRVYMIQEPNGDIRKRKWRINVVDCSDASCSAYTKGQNIYLAREAHTMADVGGNPWKTAVTDYSYDRNGNLLAKTEYDWVDYWGGWIESGAVEKRKTTMEYYGGISQATGSHYYASPQEANGYWRPDDGSDPWPANGPRRLNATRRKTVSVNSAPSAATEYVYDNAFTRGNVVNELRWDSVKSATLPALGQLSSANSQALTRGYDAYGNLTDIYEPEVRTHIAYHANGNVALQATHGYGTSAARTEQYFWTPSQRALSAKTDVDNNFTVAYAYDNLGRKTEVNEGNLRKTTTAYDDANKKATVQSDLAQFGDQLLQTRTSYDELGRVRLVQKSDGTPLGDEAAGIKARTLYHYFSGGRRVIASSPYRQTSDSTLEWTCTQYDSSNRVQHVSMFKGSDPPTDCASETNLTGRTQMAYNGSWTTVTDPAGKVRRQNRDGLGRIVEAVEDPSGLNYSTIYGYDALDNLAQVVQGDQTRTFSYSSLGRLLWATNPESGTIYYVYYDSGDLYAKLDQRGAVATMTYDPLHRIAGKSYNDGTPNVAYEYHLAGTSSAPNIGRLKSVSSLIASTTYEYDSLGRTTSSSNAIAGFTGNLAFNYDWHLNGAQKYIQYPTGRTVNYTVDDAGRTIMAYDSGTVYANSISYAPDGRMSQVKYGNNAWETRSFLPPGTDSTTYMWGTSQGYDDLLKLQYSFSSTDNNGNVQYQKITRPGHAAWIQAYGYDGVNRLLSMNEDSGAIVRSYGYDPYGNRWVSGSLIDSREPTSQAHFNASNNRLAMSAAEYDDSGNQTAYDGFMLDYDAENRITNMTKAGDGSATYYYDGDGRRVKKVWTAGSVMTTTYYVYDALGRMAVEYSTEAPAATGTSYLFTDMLGSVRAIADSARNVTECYDYLPFGRMLSSSDNGRSSAGCYPSDPDNGFSTSVPQKFTGKERDAETGLDYFGARYYSAPQGRFTSPDPLFITKARIIDPQQWNQYAYVRNNPLRLIDPDGMDATIIYSFGPDISLENREWFNENKSKIFAAITAKLNKAGVKNVHFKSKESLSKDELKQLDNAAKSKDSRETGIAGVAQLEVTGRQASFYSESAPLGNFEGTNHGRVAVYTNVLNQRGSAECDAVCSFANVAGHGIGHAFGLDDPGHSSYKLLSGFSIPEWTRTLSGGAPDIMMQGQDPSKQPYSYNMGKDKNIRAIEEMDRAKEFGK